MTEKKVLKAEGVGELIGGVTALLGYMPAHSLVIAPFVGSRAHSALRMDLHTDSETRAQMVATAMGITCRVTGVTGFAAIVYTDGTEAEHCARKTFVEQLPTLVGRRGSITTRAVGWAIGQLRREHATVHGLARQLGTS